MGLAAARSTNAGVVLVLAFGDRRQCSKDDFGEALCPQTLEGHIGILDHIVQYADDLIVCRVESQHDPQRMKDVRPAGLVDLAGVGGGSD